MGGATSDAIAGPVTASADWMMNRANIAAKLASKVGVIMMRNVAMTDLRETIAGQNAQREMPSSMARINRTNIIGASDAQHS